MRIHKAGVLRSCALAVGALAATAATATAAHAGVMKTTATRVSVRTQGPESAAWC